MEERYAKASGLLWDVEKCLLYNQKSSNQHWPTNDYLLPFKELRKYLLLMLLQCLLPGPS